PAVLVEIAFISNQREEALMKDSSWDDKVAAAIAKGFCRFAGIEYRADQPTTPPTTPPATPPPANTVMYRVIIDDRQIMALSSLANAKSEVSTRIDAGQGKVGKVQRNTDGFIEFTYSKQPALDYEREPLRVAANGVQVIALTGYSKCVAYAKANLAGKHVTLECIKDGRKWDLGVIPSLPTPGTGNDHGNLTAIVGISEASVNQLERLMHQRNTGAEYLAHIYARMEKIYQIRADIAFCQMIKETRSLMFGGDVTPEQHNPAGIGATGEGSKGATFESWDKGIEAQFQHLWAYATNKPLPVGRFKIDPRFDLVKRGAAPYVEWLGQADNPNGVGWAVPGKGYGASITALIQEAKKMSDLPLPGQTGPSKLRNGVFRLIWRQLKRLVMKLWGLFKNKQ
ncbi:MAG TPA: glucosaminidase domain-containing protein, partial [Desulfobacteria bacterium]|nr:glucosaminidase domain-containing protein [Desulfobacteria bacterium]